MSMLDRLLRRLLPPGAAGRSILGDLHEESARVRPRWLARPWYVVLSLGVCVGYALRAEPSFVRELRLAIRGLARRPGFTLTAVTTLAFGIGLTTAIFSVVDARLLRPLPYERPEELVSVWNTYPTWRGHEVLDRLWDRIALDYPEYQRWREHQTRFTDVAIYGGTRMAHTGEDEPAELDVGLASSSLFPLLGVEPALGRFFDVAEEGPSAHRLAVVSHRLWKARLGGRSAVIGQTLSLDDQPFEVVGVLPPTFRLRVLGNAPAAPAADLWIPIGADGADLGEGDHFYEGLARLAPGTTAEGALAETAMLLRGERSPEVRGARITSRDDEERGAIRRPLALLLAAVGLLLIVGSINVATVMLGDLARRGREFATRAALGAGRFRLVRQVLIEGAVLGTLGAAAGLLVARGGVALLLHFAPPGLGLATAGIGVDMRALAFSSGLGLLTGMLVAIFPALSLGVRSLERVLRQGADSVRAGGGRTQRLLITVEVALALVLLVSAGLLTRSLAATFAVDPGFSSRELLALRVTLPTTRYDGEPAQQSFYRDLQADLEALPGIRAASGSSWIPFSGRFGSSSFAIEGREPDPSGKHPEAHRQTVLPGFHQLLGIPLVAGRHLDATDTFESPGVVVVSESMAEQFWPEGDALGARIERDDRMWTVVGIVGDVLHAELAAPHKPTFYLPFDQQPLASLHLVFRSSLDPAAVAAVVRDAIWENDPALPVDEVETMTGLISRSTAEASYRTFVLLAFGIGATLLTGVGICGVTARAVTARTRELGIRLALGARGGNVVRLVLRGEALAVVAGVVIGLVAARLVGRLLEHFLYDTGAGDPWTYIGATALLLGLGLIASWLPARRVARLDPGAVLRVD